MIETSPARLLLPVVIEILLNMNKLLTTITLLCFSVGLYSQTLQINETTLGTPLAASQTSLSAFQSGDHELAVQTASFPYFQVNNDGTRTTVALTPNDLSLNPNREWYTKIISSEELANNGKIATLRLTFERYDMNDNPIWLGVGIWGFVKEGALWKKKWSQALGPIN